MSLIPTSVSQYDSLIQRGYSIRQIAREANIPYSTLQRTVRYGTAIPSQYSSSLRALYGRVNYAELRSIGFSTQEARNAEFLIPESLGVRESNINLLIDDLTNGYAPKLYQDMQAAGVDISVQEAWDMAREKIQEGLRNSRKSRAEWERYIV